MAAGLIKPAQRHDGQEVRLEANQNGGGVSGAAFKTLQNLGRPWEESQGFKPDPGNLAVRDYRGASGNVSHGGTVNPSCNRKSRSGNPSPTAGRARFLSQWALVQVDVESVEGGEIGKPGNSAKCPEAADCITCESEGRTRVSVLSSVRQGVSCGRSELRLCPMQSQWRRGRGRWSDVRRHPGVRKPRSEIRGSQDLGY